MRLAFLLLSLLVVARCQTPVPQLAAPVRDAAGPPVVDHAEQCWTHPTEGKVCFMDGTLKVWHAWTPEFGVEYKSPANGYWSEQPSGFTASPCEGQHKQEGLVCMDGDRLVRWTFLPFNASFYWHRMEVR
jgi:hypothetical protein